MLKVSPSNCLKTQHVMTTAHYSSLQTGLLLHTIANDSVFATVSDNVFLKNNMKDHRLHFFYLWG